MSEKFGVGFTIIAMVVFLAYAASHPQNIGHAWSDSEIAKIRCTCGEKK